MDLDELLIRVSEIVVDDAMISGMEVRLRKSEAEFEMNRQQKEADPQVFLRYQYTI